MMKNLAQSKRQTSMQDAYILVVEDDEGFAHLVKRLLNRKGYQVKTAKTGAQALASLENHHPMLILLDFYLPDMTVSLIVDHLQTQGLEIPFIIMTGSDDKRLVLELMSKGAEEFLIKDEAFIGLLPVIVDRTLDRFKSGTC